VNLPKFVKLKKSAQLPKRATKASAGYDLFSSQTFSTCIPAGKMAVISTGIGWDMSAASNVCGFIKPRSSLAVQYGLDTLAGVIDADYTDEIKVVLINHGEKDICISRGDKIAQLVILPYAVLMEEDKVTEIRNGGFGSTDELDKAS